MHLTTEVTAPLMASGALEEIAVMALAIMPGDRSPPEELKVVSKSSENEFGAYESQASWSINDSMPLNIVPLKIHLCPCVHHGVHHLIQHSHKGLPRMFLRL